MDNQEKRRPKNRKQAGNAVVELAVLLPLLVSLFVGVWSFGYSYYVYTELEEGVRAGARYGSLGVYYPSSPAAFQQAVKNVVVYGDSAPPAGAPPIITGITTAQVNVLLTPSGVCNPNTVTVSINGYKLYGMWGRGITLSNKPWLTVPFLGYCVP